MEMTIGDALWDIGIALSSIILMNVAFYVRLNKFKAIIFYLFLSLSYILMDYIVTTKKIFDDFFLALISLTIEILLMYICSCVVEGDVWRNFTFICSLQIFVSMFLGVSSFFSNDIKFILYNDAIFRKKAGYMRGYIIVIFLQLFFAVIISLLFKYIIRRISKRNHMFYKLFFWFYSIFGIILVILKTNIIDAEEYISISTYVFVYFIAILIFINLLFWAHNKSIRNTIKKELAYYENESGILYEKYNAIVEENQKLSNVKNDFF